VSVPDPSDDSARHEWGLSAVRCIEAAVESGRRVLPPKAEKSGWSNRILVFPCGRGQVVRALRAAFPDARITAADVDRRAVDFCVEAFDAAPLYMDEDPTQTETEATFDLIWCGSLFTHLDAARWLPMLGFLERRLRPWGILLFASNGRGRAAALGSPELELEGADEMRAELEQAGFSHRARELRSRRRDGDGRSVESWGTALTSLAWVCEQLGRRPGLRLVACAEQAWNRQLDVVACARVAPWSLIRDLARANPSVTEDELIALTGYDDETVRLQLAAQSEGTTPSPA
jgi:SAM-dependent methyltransferase